MFLRFVRLGMLLAVTALLGCAAHWQVVREAVPNPFYGQRMFAVLPIDFSGLHVGSHTEEEWLADKTPFQQQSFDEDKAALDALFLEALRSRAHDAGIVVVPATGPASAPFVLRPRVAFIEPGFYAFVASEPSRVELDLRITAPDGRVLDEVLLTHRTHGTIGIEASSGGRLRKDGTGLGTWVADYLKQRVSPPE